MKLTNEPLGLPRGSVRAILAIILVGGFIAYTLINGTANDVFMALSATVSVVIGYYFGSRSSETKGSEREAVLPDAV